ncbi:MAG: FGGY-family carbohydrate kinase [Acidimicrobiaceae bacterium]|nr:FGGY-family carbohydrate kinase [Acidimicrobiaceae bacterium]MYE65832.1 xylulose kinase [Acidimicrobiaceae bacterium]
MEHLTVGIDIGTTSVKAVAAGDDGTVVARARVPHRVVAPSPDRFEHDPQQAWVDGVLATWRDVRAGAGQPVAAVTVSAMVPSMCGVDSAGTPVTPGLLYGDARGRGIGSGTGATEGEAVGFARWLAARDGVEALWPAQSVANHALCGVAALDSSTAMAMTPMSDGQGWAPELLEEIGMTADQLPAINPGAAAVGEFDGALVSAGTIDALGEQLVAPCGDAGDVLVMCGTTLLPWILTDQWIEVEGLWTFPSARAGIMAVGGASNAGGLFVDRVRSLVGDAPSEELLALGADDLPVWLPYVRGERTPLHDTGRRAELLDLHVGHTPAHLLMAAYEAAGFVVRHHIELSGLDASRIVAVGGGAQSAAWMQALADTTGLAVDVAAEPYSAALGAAYHSRVTAGLEADTSEARRWGRVSHQVEPRASHADAARDRYRRFREGTDR